MTHEKGPVRRKSTALHEVSTFKRWVVYIDETYLKPMFGGRKRRPHELSVDNPEFDQHYQQYQDKEMRKAMSTTRLWASAGPILGGHGSYGGVHDSPTGTLNISELNRSPQTTNDRYGNYETVRTVTNKANNSPQSSRNNTLSHRSPRTTNNQYRSPYTHSLPIHEYANNQDMDDNKVTYESIDELSTDDDMRSNLQSNQSDLALNVSMHDREPYKGNH